MPRADRKLVIACLVVLGLGALLLAVALAFDVSVFGRWVLVPSALGVVAAGAGGVWGAWRDRAGQIGWSFVTAMVLAAVSGVYAWAFGNVGVVELGVPLASLVLFVAGAYGIHASRLARYDAARYGPRAT